MIKTKGLGRGLDALLGSDDDAAKTDSLLELPVSFLRPGRFQPRTRMDPASISELAKSIRQQGVLQPILVRPVAANQYEIIAGERRWRASQEAGLASVPVLVREIPDESALSMALIENIQREDLNPIEEAGGIQRLIDEFEMTHDTAAQAVGRSRSAVSNLLRLLSLSVPVRELLMEGKLDMGHARALLPLEGAQQVESAQVIVQRGLSVRDTERLVEGLLDPRRAAKRSAHRRQDRDTLRLQEELSEKLGTTIIIKAGPKKTSGRLVIHYTSLDQLDTILARFT
ncbi:MAG: ParB/RepB/Spo0J family partition protein [Betaproteobacteria bacterium]|nr:ParB/RepB/Spo0J family partition protein [Betaproteobacteria bacterium]